MPKLKTLPSHPDLPRLEEEILKFWQETKAFEQSVTQRSKDKQYVFYDGPPFATGMPHYGHLLGSTSKDVIARFWTMMGYRVERIWGWDCHGLPIENIIENKLKIKDGKKGIEKLGIDHFNQACQVEVMRLDKEWEKIIDRLGRWVDFKHNYKTMDLSYMESVWWGFGQLYEKGLIYQGKRVILYCPRCATPLSNFEIAMDNSYQTHTEASTYYKFPVAGQAKTFLLTWSTTPWNKLVTTALAVNPKLTYVKAKVGEELLILAKSRLSVLDEKNPSVVTEMTGKQLAKLEFTMLFDFYPQRTSDEKAGIVIADDFVTTDEGTGIVTLAVYGEDDYRVMQKHGVQLVEHVNEEGRLKPEVKPWAGMDILEANPLIDTALNQRGLIYKHEVHSHSVAHCYRCGTRLYYAPIPAWFINIQKLKPSLIKHNEQINWYPGHLKHGRFGKGLETAPDWNISRSRYWGTPMPIWKSADGTVRVITSLAELKDWAVDSKAVSQIDNIHRQFVDEIEVWVDADRKIKGRRIPEVFDCWVESGSMPFASRHYPFENETEFKSTYPAQFVSEYIAQTRAWFYTLHAMSVGLFDSHAVENILTTGTFMAADGNKLSKSKKNFTDPMILINQHGVDSLRLYMMSSSVMKGENVNFADGEVADIRKRVFVIWWNILSFYRLYVGDAPVEWQTPPKPQTVMDKWLVSKIMTLTRQVTKFNSDYDVVRASRTLIEFVNEFSTWYLRRSRDQIKDLKAQSTHQVFGWALVKLAQLFAPYTPFFSELVFHNLVSETNSIHHTDWPKVDESLIDPKLESQMQEIRKVAEKVHSQRKELNIRVRQPLARVMVTSSQTQPKTELLEILQLEVNIHQIEWLQKENAQLEVKLDTQLTPELKAEGEARELIRSIQKLRQKAGLMPTDQIQVTAPHWPPAWQEKIEQTTNSKLIKGEALDIR
ncbi:isoleucine--tRNA ligase [Patescibacteria group bacterium]|nr:isoleucine--tRNA ligase [Patescibacteria group bacterium]